MARFGRTGASILGGRVASQWAKSPKKLV